VAGAGIATKLRNHSFLAAGITAYLKNGGTLEKAAAMVNHASTRTTQFYDRRRDDVSLERREDRDLMGVPFPSRKRLFRASLASGDGPAKLARGWGADRMVGGIGRG
jgi:hypothetical protein